MTSFGKNTNWRRLRHFDMAKVHYIILKIFHIFGKRSAKPFNIVNSFLKNSNNIKNNHKLYNSIVKNKTKFWHIWSKCDFDIHICKESKNYLFFVVNYLWKILQQQLEYNIIYMIVVKYQKTGLGLVRVLTSRVLG